MDRLSEIRARCEAAKSVVFVGVPMSAGTRDFLESAKADMTYLLAEVEQLEDKLQDQEYQLSLGAMEQSRDEAVARAEKAEAANRWIPVEERLPEDADAMVLVIAPGRPCGNITLEGAYELATYSCADGWILEEYPDWEQAHVTHWRPLPEPPEEADHA